MSDAGRPAAGDALRAARQAAGLSTEDVADATGVSRRQVERWESGESVIVLQRRAPIAAALENAPAAELLALHHALGLAPPASTSTTPSAEVAERALQDALYAAAEHLDVSPKRLRSAVIAMLTKATALGLSGEAAAALLAQAAPHESTSTGATTR